MPDLTSCCRVHGGYCQRCDVLVGLPGLHVTGVERDETGLRVRVESGPAGVVGSPVCGVVAHAHGRQTVELIDAPASRLRSGCGRRPADSRGWARYSGARSAAFARQYIQVFGPGLRVFPQAPTDVPFHVHQSRLAHRRQDLVSVVEHEVEVHRVVHQLVDMANRGADLERQYEAAVVAENPRHRGDGIRQLRGGEVSQCVPGRHRAPAGGRPGLEQREEVALLHVEVRVAAPSLADPAWADILTPADRRGLTPLFWLQLLPYGEVRLDMNSRLHLGPAT